VTHCIITVNVIAILFKVGSCFRTTQLRSAIFSHLDVIDVVRLLLANERREREEAQKQKKELEEELNRYSTQYETAQQGSRALFMTL